MNLIAATLDVQQAVSPIWAGMTLGILWYAAQPNPRRLLIRVRYDGRR